MELEVAPGTGYTVGVPHPCDFALFSLLGLVGLRIETLGANPVVLLDS